MLYAVYGAVIKKQTHVLYASVVYLFNCKFCNSNNLKKKNKNSVYVCVNKVASRVKKCEIV